MFLAESQIIKDSLLNICECKNTKNKRKTEKNKKNSSWCKFLYLKVYSRFRILHFRCLFASILCKNICRHNALRAQWIMSTNVFAQYKSEYPTKTQNSKTWVKFKLKEFAPRRVFLSATFHFLCCITQKNLNAPFSQIFKNGDLSSKSEQRVSDAKNFFFSLFQITLFYKKKVWHQEEKIL